MKTGVFKRSPWRNNDPLKPGYAPSYSNLALMYHGRGLLTDRESLLRHAVNLSNHSYIPLLSLQQLMKENGHDAEAQVYARMLQSKRDRDPYYWIGQGMQQLSEGKFRQAISALEQAQSMTSGSEEVHRYLAVAYWRAGEKTHAEEQLALLGSLNRDGVEVSGLRKKFNNKQTQQRQQDVSVPDN